jgi:hypothetical protein
MTRRGEDPGSVTAETALALQAIGLVAIALIGVGAVAIAQLRCVDAARAGARLAARGEPAARVLRSAAAIAPANAAVTLGSAGAEAVVTVRSAIDLPLGLRLPVGSTAVADLEAAMQAQSAGQS